MTTTQNNSPYDFFTMHYPKKKKNCVIQKRVNRINEEKRYNFDKKRVMGVSLFCSFYMKAALFLKAKCAIQKIVDSIKREKLIKNKRG